MKFSAHLKNLFTKKPAPKNSQTFPGIVAARVLAVEKHPNADRLRIVKLDVGQARGLQSSIVYPVVCGAFNFDAGAVVALALPGAKIVQNIHSQNHEPFVLGTAKIRGVESQGMICAAFELGLAKEPGDKPEIMLLKNDVKPGSQFSADIIK